MRVLVTGATGFNGGHITRGLLNDGHEVFAVVRPSSDRQYLDERAHVVCYDDTSNAIFELVRAAAPDVVVHTASRFIAAHAPEDVDSLIDTNVRLGTQLLDAMMRCGVSRLVNFGTSWQHFHADSYVPVSLYAATKQAFEDIAAFYVDAAGFSTVSLKLSDTYVPDDRRGKLISVLQRAARSGELLQMSPGEQLINLAHVGDVVDAVRIAISRTMAAPLGQAEAFAVRGAELLSLQEFVATFQRATGTTVNVAWGARPYRQREVMKPWLGELLPGWAPKIPLELGLRELVSGNV